MGSLTIDHAMVIDIDLYILGWCSIEVAFRIIFLVKYLNVVSAF